MSLWLRGAAASAIGLLTLLALCTCQTASPRPAETRPSYPRYGVRQIDVLCRGVAGPREASDKDLKMALRLPPLLGPDQRVETAVSTTALHAEALADEIVRELRQRGFQAGKLPDSGTARDLVALRAAAEERGADALLLVRFVAVDQAWTGRRIRVQAPTVVGHRELDTPIQRSVDAFEPSLQRGLLLPATVQLFDARSGALLYRGPEIAPVPGAILEEKSSLLRWGELQAADAPESIAADAISRRVAGLALGRLQPAPGARDVDEHAAAATAQREPFERGEQLVPALLTGASVTRFPLALDLGPATVELPEGTLREQRWGHADLGRALGASGALELAWREERLLLLARLSERYLPGISRRTYLRSDEDVVRAFALELGPIHDLGLDFQVGRQRLLTPWMGFRAGTGPMLRWHLLGGAAPAGTVLGGLNLAFGLGASVEPFARLGPLELGLPVTASAGYDLAGGMYGGGELMLRLGWAF